MEFEDDDKPKIWHHQHEEILKEWGEISASYRWLHNQAHRKYRRQNIAFTLPVIVLNTIAGTANFSQGSFSGDYASYAPVIIGTISLIAGLLTTVAEFLKVSELSENHRSSSLAFGKLSRNIKVELSLPWGERTSNGSSFLKLCRNELDRLLDQSVGLPHDVVGKFESKFGKLNLYKPEILEVHSVSIYRNEKERQEEHIGKIVVNARDRLNKREHKTITEHIKPYISRIQSSVGLNSKTQEVELQTKFNEEKEEEEKTELNDNIV
jgi:hypothetical protein